MTARALLAAAGVAVCCLWLEAAQAAEQYAARLDTVPIDSRTQAAVTGSGEATAVLDGDELVIEGSFAGLTGAATSAWLHVGAAIGARGPAAHELTVSPGIRGDVRGMVTLDRNELEALRSGRLYLQIQSQSAPEGNLWGWLLLQE